MLLSHWVWNDAFFSNMFGPGEHYTKWSQIKTYIIYHLYPESKKMIQMTLYRKKKQTHRLRKQTYSYQRKGGFWIRDWYIHIYTTVTNKDLLYNTRNSAQYSIIPQLGKFWKRIDTCICITELLCCTSETNTTWLVNYIPI